MLLRLALSTTIFSLRAHTSRIYRKPLGSWAWHCGIYKYNANKYAGNGENLSIAHLVDSKEFSSLCHRQTAQSLIGKSHCGVLEPLVTPVSPGKPPFGLAWQPDDRRQRALAKPDRCLPRAFRLQPTDFRLTFLSALKYNPKALNYARSDVRKSAGSNYVGGLKSDSGALDFPGGGMTHSHSQSPPMVLMTSA